MFATLWPPKPYQNYYNDLELCIKPANHCYSSEEEDKGF